MKKVFCLSILVPAFILMPFIGNSYGEKRYKFAVIQLTISDVFAKFLKDMEEITKSISLIRFSRPKM